ncbi:TAXI family TRAP transporter solute-binding subunit [Sedimentitalea todarodis]|uniref:TAXI family TRAP transporter solute-binding subunit n=1 Tax=Sedimentitalea todarodis TaxID=1631240 RepID=A0ABU3V838_9RHOB|nr:TAXI family TRAP transporter solute-binding subunit [Sedimentitalea todarodis]MDU9002278.1 TAXI family TRAP transporter solute-binding subunit [Sedimentitalea todarodis]
MKLRKKSILARFVALAVLLTGMSLPAQAQVFEKNILTGGPSGTYIQFGRNVSEIAAKCGVDLQVQESAGSLENFLGVRKRRFTQFGIVQSDVLEYLKTFAADDPGVARAILGVRIAFPLYNEEVHVLGTNDINSLADLNGKRVAVGVEDSGTFLTASLVLDLAQVNPADRLTINADDSLKALMDGQIDAFFYVAGAPTKIFQSPEIDAARFHLVPISDPTLQAVYEPATIPAGAYPFQSDAVDVVAVKAVLMTYEYDPNRNAYHRESCKAVSDISHLISTRFGDLQANGHPKWQQVDPSALPPGWNIGSCVNVGLDPNYPLVCEGDQPTAATGETPSESEANSAYRRQICATIGC